MITAAQRSAARLFLGDPMQAHFRIRSAVPADVSGIAHVQISTWHATYRGLVPDAYLDAMDQAVQEDYWRSLLSANDGDFVVVAESQDLEIAGFACAGPNRDVELSYVAELHKLYLAPKWQGRGVGRRLIESAAESLLQQNLTSMIVWVLGGNPFRTFYESVGGTFVSERTIDIGGVPLLDVAYGWRNLHQPLKA
ncbi:MULTISPECIES: GNAT family N-acetyltransferase [unclassified Pseudoxanthomonas]|uniref:GNAT family N-acetyltransferase n=1 Tax=unclassified Pseudoxanthomonas TaxID=2645906 RepID=UPI0030786CBF